MIITELEDIKSFIFDDVHSSSDQDADQDEKETKGLTFTVTSKKLLEYLQRISNGMQYVNENPIIYEKYKSAALDLTSEQASILNYAYSPLSNKELQEQALKMKAHHDNFKNHIEPLLQRGFLERTIKDKPTSKYQKYFTTARGKRLLSVWNQIHDTDT